MLVCCGSFATQIFRLWCTMSKTKKWTINIIIAVVVTVVMLALAEVGMRWLDGYRLSTFELKQGVNQTQPK